MKKISYLASRYYNSISLNISSFKLIQQGCFPNLYQLIMGHNQLTEFKTGSVPVPDQAFMYDFGGNQIQSIEAGAFYDGKHSYQYRRDTPKKRLLRGYVLYLLSNKLNSDYRLSFNISALLVVDFCY